LWRTLRWDAAVVFLELAIALPIALFLNQSFKGRGIVRSAVMVPYITPPAVVGLLFCYMFDGNFGVINDLLVRIGVLDRYVAWLSDPTGSFWVVVSAMVWYGQPLMALILLAALQTIPPELYEAAKVDGAGALRTFWHITLPHLMPSIMFLILLRTIWMSNHIDMIFVMTGGGPGFSNHTEAVYSFTLTNQFQIGYASAVAVVLAIILVAASALYVRHLARTVLTASAS
jgi:multiple sugar transport system permease protein